MQHRVDKSFPGQLFTLKEPKVTHSLYNALASFWINLQVKQEMSSKKTNGVTLR